MAITDEIKNGILSAPRISAIRTNAPAGTGPRGSHWSTEAALMYQKIGPYAGNVFDAEIQGLDYNDFYAWQKCILRAAPVVDATTGDNMGGDWQRIMVINRRVDFIPAGAYVRFNGNTWIVYNPENVASDIGTAVLQRCNGTYNTLDWYGNVVKTPMSLAKGKVLASSPYFSDYSSVMDGYAHAVLQLNEATADLHDNTRVLLGSSAYAFYGVVNYAQEFTGDDDSVHIIKTDLRVNEILENDDRVNRVADGNAFRFTVDLDGLTQMAAGETQTLSAVCRRNGETVESTAEHPVTLTWESSDESVCEVDENGGVFAVGAGECEITCTLAQNTQKSATVKIAVHTAISGNSVAFVGAVPNEAGVFTSFPVQAAYFESGIQTDAPIAFAVSGVPENAVTLTDNGDGTAVIDVWTASGTLIITASSGDYSASASVTLEGF